ncbi:uncharacterized protein J3D65DRAFT_635507, partial [Phyllosticta citribraziliensis]
MKVRHPVFVETCAVSSTISLHAATLATPFADWIAEECRQCVVVYHQTVSCPLSKQMESRPAQFRRRLAMKSYKTRSRFHCSLNNTVGHAAHRLSSACCSCPAKSMTVPKQNRHWRLSCPQPLVAMDRRMSALLFESRRIGRAREMQRSVECGRTSGKRFPSPELPETPRQITTSTAFCSRRALSFRRRRLAKPQIRGRHQQARVARMLPEFNSISNDTSEDATFGFSIHNWFACRLTLGPQSQSVLPPSSRTAASRRSCPAQ